MSNVTAVAVAAYTTSLARVELYKRLDLMQDRVRMGIKLESYETFFHLTGEYISPRYAYLPLVKRSMIYWNQLISLEYRKNLRKNIIDTIRL